METKRHALREKFGKTVKGGTNSLHRVSPRALVMTASVLEFALVGTALPVVSKAATKLPSTKPKPVRLTCRVVGVGCVERKLP